jgi:hypothetical protein
MPLFRSRRCSTLLGFAALLATTLSLASAAPAQAQVLSDPRIAEFDPSPDHWTVLDGGQPAVVWYELGVYALGASAPFATVDMGKPSPDADGKIRYDFSTQVAAWTLPGGDYDARVSAVGPEGAALSDPSNPFTFTTASTCTLSLSPATVSAPVSGGNFVAGVSTGAGCSWTATTAVTWVTLGMKSGSGNATVPFAVQANASKSGRTGTIVVGGQSLTIWQDGLGTPTISWATPAPITEGTALSSAQLNATASVPGSFAYSPTAGTVLPAGQYTLKATFTPADLTLYTTATAYVNFTVTSTTYQLTVNRPAGGTVIGGGVNCGTNGTNCQVTAAANSSIGLTATPDSGYSFAGWTGDCTGTTSSFTVVLNGPKSCGATFVSASSPPSTSTPLSDGGLPIGPPHTLTIVRPSGGTVKGTGINCGTTAKSCQVTAPGPMNFALQATPDYGFAFLAWTGDCSGTSGSYLLALEGPRSCGASFVQIGQAKRKK